MAHYNVEQLLRIYGQVYCHEVQTLVRNGDQKERLDLILDLANFGNQIARLPDHEQTQNIAREYIDYITRAHQRTLAELEKGEWNHPCECMRGVIQERMETLEKTADGYDESEEGLARWAAYERWLEYHYRMEE